MIKLELDEYCQNCPDFVSDVEKDHKGEFINGNCFSRGDLKLKRTCNTVIRCKYRKRCEELVDTYLRYELKGGE